MLWGHRPVLKELVKDYTDVLLLLAVLYAGSTEFSSLLAFDI